jgi:hypothetical protein
MAISTDAGIWFPGTQDEVTSGTPATISSGSFGKADQGASVAWTNADDAPWAAAVLKCQFDTTMPTAGAIHLYAHLLNIQSTNDTGAPDANYPHRWCAWFPIDFGVSADTDFYTETGIFALPMHTTAQAVDWYIENRGTSQTLGVSWQLWITPLSLGPHA